MSDGKESFDINELNAIWAARGRAIDAYAMLEQALCNVLSHAGGMSDVVASTVFYKISNSGARNQIIEKLIHRKFGVEYNLFWNWFFKELRQIDGKRNEVVHWKTVTFMTQNEAGDAVHYVAMVAPNIYDYKLNSSRIGIPELADFMSECSILMRLCNRFVDTTSVEGYEDQAAPWRDIFRQPLTYPLPAGHPLLQTEEAHETPPQSSPG